MTNLILTGRTTIDQHKRFLQALIEMKNAAEKIVKIWDEQPSNVEQMLPANLAHGGVLALAYPVCLPSFDEFVLEIKDWLKFHTEVVAMGRNRLYLVGGRLGDPRTLYQLLRDNFSDHSDESIFEDDELIAKLAGLLVGQKIQLDPNSEEIERIM